ncbi:MAG TPA: hypothetical protein VEC93_22545 [Anaerolineae bacterium]|nr:hypothetical protein [Anaerolineae bacterium]
MMTKTVEIYYPASQSTPTKSRQQIYLYAVELLNAGARPSRLPERLMQKFNIPPGLAQKIARQALNQRR